MSGAGLARRCCTGHARAPCRAVSNVALFYNIMIGYFFGFALGVGSALAVFYAIYTGGYRRAVEHSLLQQKPQRYVDALAAAERSAEREAARSS